MATKCSRVLPCPSWSFSPEASRRTILSGDHSEQHGSKFAVFHCGMRIVSVCSSKEASISGLGKYENTPSSPRELFRLEPYPVSQLRPGWEVLLIKDYKGMVRQKEAPF